MMKEFALNIVYSQLRRVGSVQLQLLDRMEAHELKKLGIKMIGAEIKNTSYGPVNILTIRPINPTLGDLFGWLTFVEAKFFQSLYEILENKPLFDSEGNINI